MILCSSTQQHENSCYCPICDQKRKEWIIEHNNYVKWLIKTCFHEPYQWCGDIWACVKCSVIIPMFPITVVTKGDLK